MSEDESSCVLTTLRSDVAKSDVGSFPLTTPATVVTPTTVTSVVVTPTTLARIGSSDVLRSEYSIKLLTFIFPGNNLSVLEIVLTPLRAVTDATPTSNDGVCMIFALNVLIPTILIPSVPAAIPVSE